MPLFTLPGSWVENYAITTYATNRTGATLTVGDVCSFDLTGSDGDVTAYSSAATLDVFANVIVPVAAHLVGWVFCVALEATTNDSQGRFLVRGVTSVITAGSTAVVAGDNVMPQASDTVTKTTDGKANIGIALEAGPTGATAAAKLTLFDGWALSASGAAAV